MAAKHRQELVVEPEFPGLAPEDQAARELLGQLSEAGWLPEQQFLLALAALVSQDSVWAAQRMASPEPSLRWKEPHNVPEPTEAE